MMQFSGVQAVLTDIEGTTSSIAFVHDVLFPYARAHLEEYVRTHQESLSSLLDDVRSAAGDPGLDTDGVIAVLQRWIDEDRKITVLKTIQGMIWRRGYEAGELKGHIYADAVAGLQKWHGAGLLLYVYSSGSEEAQRLIFGHTDYGDLTPWFSGFFDTTIGGKLEAGSYTHIAVKAGMMPRSFLFLSDNPLETAAARRAGMQTVLLARADEVRPAGGEAAESSVPDHTEEVIVSRFSDIEIVGRI